MAEEKKDRDEEELIQTDSYDEPEQLITHKRINTTYSGDVLELKKGRAKVVFVTTQEMAVDDMELVHTGFIFSAANFTAIAAVNEPNSVLVEADVKFLSPMSAGKKIFFEGIASHTTTRTRDVVVIGVFNDLKIFEGEFKIIALEKHPLRLKLV